MADSDSDSIGSDIIRSWTMVNELGEVEVSFWASLTGKLLVHIALRSIGCNLLLHMSVYIQI